MPHPPPSTDTAVLDHRLDVVYDRLDVVTQRLDFAAEAADRQDAMIERLFRVTWAILALFACALAWLMWSSMHQGAILDRVGDHLRFADGVRIARSEVAW
jgi:hypothetical protein